MPEITKIVITGGPCAGKTTAMSRIQNEFMQMGYTVLLVPETAAEFTTDEVTPWACNTDLDYQLCQMKLQAEKEQLFYRTACTMNADKILIACNRGQLDNKAYMTETEFQTALSQYSWNETELRDSYHAVFHLVTAANGAEEFYNNNKARNESVTEAVALDQRLISAWTGHPHLRIIDNSTDFEGKMHRLIAEIASFLGEPEPLEIERKFLIDYPDLAYLESLAFCKRVDIVQTYLKSPDGSKTRVRKRGSDGGYVYFQTTKKQITPVKRIEIEKRLSEREYRDMLMNTDANKWQISKARYCLVYNDQYFEIDVYPFWQDKAIMEIELPDEDTPIDFPPFIHIQKEVTEDKSYSNYRLAKKFNV